MDFRWPDAYLAFRDEVETFIHQWRTPELAAEMREREGAAGPLTRNYYKALQEKGWMRMCWPREMGGEGRDPLYQFILVETMEYWRMPYGNLTFTSVAPSIAQYGNEHQKRTYLPGIWNGDLTFAIGYSEPNAGTDLAALRTRDHGPRAGEVERLRQSDQRRAGGRGTGLAESRLYLDARRSRQRARRLHALARGFFL